MFEVCVPATSANLSCGFDVLGLTLDLFYIVQVEEREGFDITISHVGEGESEIPQGEKNIFVQAVRTVWKEAKFSGTGMKAKSRSTIPVKRGLGSSAACVVAGVTAGNILAGNPFKDDVLMRLATLLEGHPDNVMPAFVGGFVATFLDREKIYFKKYDFFSDLEMIVCIPPYQLSTGKMRKMLPQCYSRRDVVFNLSRIAHLVGSVAMCDREGFFAALEDRVHEPYRGKWIKGYFEVKEFLDTQGLGKVIISGSGPTLILFLRLPWNSSVEKEIRKIFYAAGVDEIQLKKVSWVNTGVKVVVS